MLLQPTLFVVGAGASADLNFPVGVELRDQISDILDLRFLGIEFEGSDTEFASYLSRWCFENNIDHHRFWEAATAVSRSLPLSASIDSYLDSHLTNPLRSACAKLAIARLISVAENKSALACDNNRDAAKFDFRPLCSTWYQRLWSVLQTGVTPNDPQRAFTNLKLITFNYDRNIERFLHLAYSHFLDVPLEIALSEVESLGIIHIYGSLGRLEANPDNCRSYRSNGYITDLSEGASGISTYTEEVKSKVVHQVHELVWQSQRIIFLGFSFGAANMNLLSQATMGQEIQRSIYATTYGMSDEAIENVRNQLDAAFSRGFQMANLRRDKAAELFDRYTGVF